MTDPASEAVRAKPAGVSDYRWRKFVRFFQHGAEFWTSEDGMLMSLVILRTPDAMEILKREHAYHWERHSWEGIAEMFAYEEWVGADFFDGPYPTRRRAKAWRVQAEPTPFPVYELRIA